MVSTSDPSPKRQGLRRRPANIGHRPLGTTLALVGWCALVCLPLVYVMSRAIAASRNIVYWDEFDTVLSFALRLDEGVTVSEFLHELFAINNEHRMVTSRLITSLSFWVLGTVDFNFLSFVGNASVVVLAALLVREMPTQSRRIRLAVVLGFVVFHLAHFENLYWPGSSIDHFLIVLLAGVAVAGVARRSRAGMGAGMISATLATFTLAHGVMTWPIGAAMLWREKRYGELKAWCAVAVLVVIGFLLGFRLNPSHAIPDTSFAGLGQAVVFWMRLLGTVPALGFAPIAPWAGVLLLAAVLWLSRTGAVRRERVLFPLTWFALAATALIALGRAEGTGGAVHSRYLILSALAWALTACMLLNRYSHPRRPLRLLMFALPLMIAFNVGANLSFADEADSWVECRDRAAVRFIDAGHDGDGAFKLHPQPEHATRLLLEAERRGIYRMPPVCEARSFPDAKPSTRIEYFVEQMKVDRDVASITGWAAIRGQWSTRGSLHLVLRSEHKMHVYTTVAVSRADIVEAFKEPKWLKSGFRFARARDRLPAGEYQVGFLIQDGDRAEYIMTAHRVNLDGAGAAQLATGK